MENEHLILEIATKACREVLQDYLEEIAEGVARRMNSALAGQISQGESERAQSGGDRTKELHDGTLRITRAKTQTEALESLLAASSTIAPRCGLLILRGAVAAGWSCHGITTAENFRLASLDCSQGIAAKTISSGASVVAQASEFEARFIHRLGMTGSEQVLLVPVTLKERVAALLIAVSGNSSDLAALEVLVQVAQLALDMQSYRKSAPQAVASPAPQHHSEAHHSDVHHTDGHQADPRHDASYSTARAATAPVPQVVTAPVHEAPRSAATVPVLDEAHEKARRFAKLLVEEIKLYNQTKVAEGRARGDLYSRLQEDIEKSRAAYQKRYGESVRDVDFFTQELIRILADNNRGVMGPGFPG